MQNLHPPEMDALAKKQLKSYILNYVVYDWVLFGLKTAGFEEICFLLSSWRLRIVHFQKNHHRICNAYHAQLISLHLS